MTASASRSWPSLTAACLTSQPAIDLSRPERLVAQGDERQRLLLGVADELYGRNQAVSLNDLLAELDGEDLDRVIRAMAMLKRRQLTTPEWPADLWIRAAEPQE